MSYIEFFTNSPGWFISAVALLGLMVGSFLNVVVFRLPRRLNYHWTRECRQLLGHPADVGENPPPGLIVEPSHCPSCGHHIRFYENIPVLSFLLLGGQCSACGAGISLRYPAVEVFTALLSGVIAWKFGVTMPTLYALIFTWILISISFIDLDTQLIPDNLSLPLLWGGLLVNLDHTFALLSDAVIGAAAGYLLLWLIFHLFKLVTGKEGMGYGDFKLLAALGAWMGWQAIPMIILLSSVVGAVIGILMMIFRRSDRNQAIPFGPFLAGAGWLAFVWGGEIMSLYNHFMGVGA